MWKALRMFIAVACLVIGILGSEWAAHAQQSDIFNVNTDDWPRRLDAYKKLEEDAVLQWRMDVSGCARRYEQACTKKAQEDYQERHRRALDALRPTECPSQLPSNGLNLIVPGGELYGLANQSRRTNPQADPNDFWGFYVTAHGVYLPDQNMPRRFSKGIERSLRETGTVEELADQLFKSDWGKDQKRPITLIICGAGQGLAHLLAKTIRNDPRWKGKPLVIRASPDTLAPQNIPGVGTVLLNAATGLPAKWATFTGDTSDPALSPE